MGLFKSTNNNKSQASLERHIDSGDQSPIQNDSAYSQAQLYGGTQHPSQLLQQPQQPQQLGEEQRYYRDHIQSPTHPAQVPTRTQSNRVPSASVDAYGKDPQHQPTVNVVPPLSPITPIQQGHPSPGQINPVQQQPVARVDREQKSKKSFWKLGLGNSSHDKDYAGDRRNINRTSSVLRKASHQQPPSGPSSPQGLQTGQFSPPDAGPNAYGREHSAENLPSETEQFDQYYRPENQLDRSQRQSVRYVEDAPQFDEPPPTPRHHKQPSLHSQQSQPVGYEGYQPTSANNSTTYLHSELQNAATNNPLRPPSPASIGPPSPLVGAVQHPDSRPTTADLQSRYIAHTAIQPAPHKELLHQRQVSQDVPRSEHEEAMGGRNEGSNGGSRQHREDERQPPPHYPNQQDPRLRAQGHDQGRNTPPPRNREDLNNLDYSQLIQKHEELLVKYSKVKRYYFDREAQVTQLQNTVANQRLSLSKTSLDDAQYATRFDRLNGAIQNLSFNIRKEWRRIPNWLTPVCNRDACQVGTKEMTAIGRACITRWLFEYLFEQVFHPGIDPNLSAHLKGIERNLRRSQYGPGVTSEQADDLMLKIMTWRLTTVEGLNDAIQSQQAHEFTDTLVHNLTKQLHDYMKMFLKDPLPPGLYDNLFTLISQAVSICANIPLESRDVCINYFFPAAQINETYMRLESGMTPLQNPGSAPSASDTHMLSNNGSPSNDEDMSTSSEPSAPSQADLEAQIREASAKGTAAGTMAPPRKDSISSGVKNPLQTAPSTNDKNSARDQKKTGFFGISKKPAPSTTPNTAAAGQTTGLALQHTDSSKSSDSTSDAYNINTLTAGLTDGKIRFAAFLTVEVRGRSVLTLKDGDKGKENDKLPTQGGDSAGVGQQATDGGAGSVKGDKSGINVLVKAPVYAFE